MLCKWEASNSNPTWGFSEFSVSATQIIGHPRYLGTGGITPLLSIDTADPRIGYFRSWMGANINQTWGISQFTVSARQLIMKFVPTSGGTFTDNFTIHV